MKIFAAIAMIAMVAACAHRLHRQKAEAVVPAPVVTQVQHVAVPRHCGAILRAWLQPQATIEKSRGVVADAAALASVRGDQVDTLNARLLAGNKNLQRIASALSKYDCVELR